MADLQRFSNVFGGQALHQVGRHLALAWREFCFHRAACAQVLKTPNAGFVRRIAVQRTSGDVAPKSLALEAAVQPFHDAVVGIGATAVEDGADAGAGAFVFIGAGVEHLERLSDELGPVSPEHLA